MGVVACALCGCEEKKKQVEEEVRERVSERVETIKERLEERKASAADERGMFSLSDAEFDQKFQDDLAELRRYDEGLRRVLAHARTRDELFPWGWKEKDVTLTGPQRDELRAIWAAVLDYMHAIDGVKSYWRGFHRVNALKQRERHAGAFLIGYTAWMIQYHHGLEFVDMTVPSKPLELVLDEGEPRLGVTAGAFKKLKWNVINVAAIARFLGSHQYFKVQKIVVGEGVCLERPGCAWALQVIERYHEGSKERLAERAAIQFSYNAFDIARDFGFQSWFPVQREVAEWMGDTKVRRLHQHLVTQGQLEKMRRVMAPGDILVTRKNWYLSNIGLPGFWPHAELYLGAPDELDAYMDDDEVREGLGHDGPFSKLLEARYPRAWAAYTAAPEHGEVHRILEAVSEGVVFSSMLEGAGADYVGVMRPRRSKLDKARAILRAFAYWGRDYDFNFDFATDETIVCTELVYKAWEPSPKKRGVALEMVDVMGRATLPANDIVRQFDAQRELPDGERQLDFVYFLDGFERVDVAVVGDEDGFASSWRRPKWDVVQP